MMTDMGLLLEVSGEGGAVKGYGTAKETDVDLELRMLSVVVAI